MRRWWVIAGLGFVVALGLFGIKVGSNMLTDRLGVVIYVTPEVIEKGAVVSIMTRQVPVDEFEARYPVPETPPDIPGAPAATRQWYGTVSGPVNMVFFDIPDDKSYSYQFRSLPVDGTAQANVSERVLTVGGISLDAEGRDTSYDEFGLNRAHEIAQLDVARAWVPDISDYESQDIVCQDGSGVRVCMPTLSALEARADYLTKSTPDVDGRAPWEQ
ncbi:MAG: hypothetical protein ACRC6I_04360 [Paracoccaceae bacterium]